MRARAHKGSLDAQLPANGIGRLQVQLTLPTASGLRGTTATSSIRATTKSLSVGSSGPAVRALVTRLRYLHFHSPGLTSRYDARVGDMVLAFHKWKRMGRTTRVDNGTWRALAAATFTAALIGALSLVVFGPETWAAFFHSIPHTTQVILAGGNAGWNKLQTVYGFTRWIGASDAMAWNFMTISVRTIQDHRILGFAMHRPLVPACPRNRRRCVDAKKRSIDREFP